MARAELTDKDFIAFQAPEFHLDLAPDRKVRLSELKGHWVVLYFYPKDDTPSCTNEAKDFSELKPQFDALGAKLFGVSKDPLKAHARFKAKYDLKHDLLSDETGEAVEAFGVWVEKSLYGRQYMGIERSTFLIDPEGIVRRVWHSVKVKGHAQDVLAGLKALMI